MFGVILINLDRPCGLCNRTPTSGLKYHFVLPRSTSQVLNSFMFFFVASYEIVKSKAQTNASFLLWTIPYFDLELPMVNYKNEMFNHAYFS